MTWREDMKQLMTEAFMAGVKAVHPDAFLSQKDVRFALGKAAEETKGRVLVFGAGKASSAMATALEREWNAIGGKPLQGLVVTRQGYGTPTENLEVAFGGHPYPEKESYAIAKRMLKLADGLTQDDLLIGLWSGGGSSLLSCPPADVPFSALQQLTKELVLSGAEIELINTVRKHLSQIAGGRLAKAAAPAGLLNLIIPDVVDEENEISRLSAVASGPCVPDPTTLADAVKVLEDYEVVADPASLTHLRNAANETPKTWADMGLSPQHTIVMPDDTALAAMSQFLENQSISIIHRDKKDVGSAWMIGGWKVGTAISYKSWQEPMACLMAGEAIVSVTGNGKGGPNQEYALTLAISLDGESDICALSADTDGIDGMGEAAGAFVFPDTLSRMRAAGIDPEAALRNNDSGTAFEAIGDLLITGPTFTNVNDLRLIVING